jgi:UDP-3-O-[3-hydroxymyristoyl] glucosamine N-acyltransferase
VNVSVRQLADWVRGEVVGDGDVAVSAARPLSEAGPGDITYVDGTRNLPSLYTCGASAAVVPLSVPANGKPLIRVADPLAAFAAIVRQFRDETAGPEDAADRRIDPTACIHPTAVLGADVTIGPYAVVGAGVVLGARCHLQAGVNVGRRCRLGDDVTLYPHVVLYTDCLIGNRVTIHANAVIGADGFGYRTRDGRHEKVPQLGRVEIGDDVEIGAGSTIDRATFGATRIGEGTKIDNMVMIGHNCQIGRHNLLAAQVGVAGSCTTGDYVVMAGQAGIADHLAIGDRVVVAAQSGVTKSFPSGVRLLGYPAGLYEEKARVFACLEKLPELRKDLQRIKKALGLEDKA